jgi:hypothetical protein
MRIRELDVHKIGRFEGADDSDKAQRTLDGFSFFVMIQDKRKMRERVSSLDEVGELALAHVSADGYVGSDLGEEGSQRSSKLARLCTRDDTTTCTPLILSLSLTHTHTGVASCY